MGAAGEGGGAGECGCRSCYGDHYCLGCIKKPSIAGRLREHQEHNSDPALPGWVTNGSCAHQTPQRADRAAGNKIAATGVYTPTARLARRAPGVTLFDAA